MSRVMAEFSSFHQHIRFPIVVARRRECSGISEQEDGLSCAGFGEQ